MHIPLLPSIIFNEIWYRPSVSEQAFNREWENRDLLAEFPYGELTKLVINVGDIRRSRDTFTDDRILLVGTRLGAIVLYTTTTGKIRSTWPKRFPASIVEAYTRNRDLGGLELGLIVGGVGFTDISRKNIGVVIEELFDVCSNVHLYVDPTDHVV